MSNHIRRPGIQLLSLVNPSESSTKSFLDTPCLLPDQYGIYSSLHLPFFMFSAVALLVLNLRRSRQSGVHHIEPLAVSPRNSPSSSGRSTPLTHPESTVWSPYTPPAPVSPRGALPSSLRIANGHGSPAMFRASRPVTPLGSPFLPPAIYPPEEDDESMYPTQYAMRRDGRPQDADNWLSGHERISSDPQMLHFTAAPGRKPNMKRGWSWSWTFVFRGRRRRMTLRVPEFVHGVFSEVQAWVMGRGDKQISFRHHGVVYMTMMDGFSILWPAVILWVLLTWWIF
jgi:ethanolamine phosphate phosphodiesterase